VKPLATCLATLTLACAAPGLAEPSALPARLEAMAARGNAEADYHLGMLYHLGLEGVAVDHRRAFAHFQRGAAAGDPLAAYKLGCYYAGQAPEVVAPDEASALRYKLIAAEAGYVLAQMDVAAIYDHRGDHIQALRWYEAAARQGDWTALFMASLQVRPDLPQADRARGWLFFRVIDRTLTQLEQQMPRDEAARSASNRVGLRRFTEAGLSAADRAEGERLFAAWRVERTPVTLRADQRLDAARHLVDLAESASARSR
jgi:uncharacterized protein